MNQDIKQRWIDALLSGEFRQGEGVLKAGDEYCCLGVLCELHSRETGIEWSTSENTDGFIFTYLGCQGILPIEVYQWAGLPSEDPYVGVNIEDNKDNEGDESLSALNDGGYTFQDIAHLIEESL